MKRKETQKNNISAYGHELHFHPSLLVTNHWMNLRGGQVTSLLQTNTQTHCWHDRPRHGQETWATEKNMACFGVGFFETVLYFVFSPLCFSLYFSEGTWHFQGGSVDDKRHLKIFILIITYARRLAFRYTRCNHLRVFDSWPVVCPGGR